MKSGCSNNYLTSLLIVTLLTIVRIWNPPTYPSTNAWIKKMWTIDNVIVSNHKKKIFCHLWQHGWTWGHYVKWNEPRMERPTPHDLTHRWNLKQWSHGSSKSSGGYWSLGWSGRCEFYCYVLNLWNIEIKFEKYFTWGEKTYF